MITSSDLRIIFKSMRLSPGPRVLAQILKDASPGPMTYAQFRQMRLERRKCELNVLAEFKKFDIDHEKKGLLTKKSLRKVLTFEGFDEDVKETIVNDYMALDRNKDGYISYKDLYDYVMGELNAVWQDWLDKK